jgi:hypothetical protein
LFLINHEITSKPIKGLKKFEIMLRHIPRSGRAVGYNQNTTKAFAGRALDV